MLNVQFATGWLQKPFATEQVQWRGTERPTSCEGNQRSTPVRCQLWVPIIRVDCTCGVQGLMLLEYFGVGHEQTG